MLPDCPFPWNSSRLVSLWDMILHHCLSFSTMYQRLEQTISELNTFAITHGLAVDLSANDKKRLAQMPFDSIIQECDAIDLPVVVNNARRIKIGLERSDRYSSEIVI